MFVSQPVNLDPFDDEEDVNSEGVHRVQAASMRRSVADDVRAMLRTVNDGILETSEGRGRGLRLPRIAPGRGAM